MSLLEGMWAGVGVGGRTSIALGLGNHQTAEAAANNLLPVDPPEGDTCEAGHTHKVATHARASNSVSTLRDGAHLAPRWDGASTFKKHACM
jgi:hypothetical protein